MCKTDSPAVKNMEEKKATAPLEVKSLQEAVSIHSPIVKRLADRPCLTYHSTSSDSLGSISWSTFAERVENLAARIQATPSGRVAIILRRTCSLVIAEAAAHLAGRTFIPLDPNWPRGRVEKILKAGDVATVILDEGLSGPSDSSGSYRPSAASVSKTYFLEMNKVGQCVSTSERVGQDDDCVSVESQAEVPPLRSVPQPDVMYIMFTSGSTGEPKGVEVYTDGVYHYLRWRAHFQNHTDADTHLLKTPCTFDVSIGEMWIPLVSGARSHVLGDGDHLDPAKVHEELVRGKVTICHFVPSVLLLYCAEAEAASFGPTPDLRMIQCTGEAVKMEHRKKVTEIFGSSMKIINLYGPTEASVEVTWFDCEDDDTLDLSHGFPIGWIPEGVGVHIVNPDDPNEKLKDGEKGEILLSGVQVAKGYLGREDLTSERFIPCPWDKSGQGTMYRTGDLGRLNPETGFLEYNGRFDRQVKVGGVRIELGEIEAVIMRSLDDRIENIAVILLGGVLVGVAVPKTTASGETLSIPSPKEMSDVILSTLPKAYNPTEWHSMSSKEIPLNNAGKIDMNGVAEWVRRKRTSNVWAEVWDQSYEENDTSTELGADPTMDWAGYFDSFDPSKLHTRPVIKEWVMQTVEWTLANAKQAAGSEEAASVLEMGCGKGMILLKMAPRVKVCIGCDISERAVGHVKNIWNGYMKENDQQGLSNAFAVVQCDAVGFDKLPDTVSSYHTIVCNGVSMYMPSFGYVLDYLNGASDRIVDKTGGAVLLGDVRSLHHSPVFQLRRLKQVGKSAEEARNMAETLAMNDKDRTYDHRAFHALWACNMLRERVAAVEVQLKEGKEDSEFSGYRFDVTLHCLPNGMSQDDNETYEVVLTKDFKSEEAVTPEMVATSLKSAWDSESRDRVVFACLNIPNQRLYADHLLACGRDDGAILADPEFGVKPATLRTMLNEQFPDMRSIVTFSRETNKETHFSDDALARMDVYLVSDRNQDERVAGLQAVSRHCLEPHMEKMAPILSGTKSGIETYISSISEQSSVNAGSGSKKGDGAAISASREFVSQGNFKAAVQALIASSLGMPFDKFQEMINSDEVGDDVTFEEIGGNSFIGMKLVSTIRSNLGTAPAVFKLLTEPLAHFTTEAEILLRRKKESADSDWLIHSALPGNKSDVVSPDAPAVILFPTAGGSPKVFAHTFSELRKQVSSSSDLSKGCDVYIVQPPGRDARAEEENMKDLDKFICCCSDAIASALKLGQSDAIQRKVVMCGDSLGSIMCWSVAHELQRRFGFTSDHLILSGNPCPAVAEEEWGLGSYATKSIYKCTDDELAEFLSEGGRGGFDKSEEAETLNALRCDCIMYEDFSRKAELKTLPIGATLCHGEEDPFCGPVAMQGWVDEFDGTVTDVTLPNAGHHIYSDCGPTMANIIVEQLVNRDTPQ